MSCTTYQEFLKSAPISKDGFQEFREESKRRFLTVGFPKRNNESWKYINVDSILNLTVSENAGKTFEKNAKEILEPYFLGTESHTRLAFVNGVYSEALSDICDDQTFSIDVITRNKTEKQSRNRVRHVPSGLAMTYLTKALQKETNPFALINGFRFQNGIVLLVKKNESVKTPIHLLLSELAGETEAHDLRIVIVLEENASASVIFDHIGASENAYFENVVTEIHLGKGSKLDWLNLTRESKSGFHFHTLRSFQEKDSSFQSLFFSKGGAITRNETHVYFTGENASCDLKGLTLTNDDSQIFNEVVADHLVGQCVSRQLFKTILAGKSKSEINSLVYMHKDAQKSDSNQLIKNLLLSKDARVYSRPQLEIHADDVKATHGAATGQLSRQELFYLKSRGLSEKQARFMLTYGFAEEVVEHIKFPSIRAQIEYMVQKEIKNLVS